MYTTGNCLVDRPMNSIAMYRISNKQVTHSTGSGTPAKTQRAMPILSEYSMQIAQSMHEADKVMGPCNLSLCGN